MSIIAYTGLPGSGKSYSVVQHQIVPALKRGRTVVTNVPLRMEAVELFLARSGCKNPGAVVEFPIEAVAAEPHTIRDYVKPGVVFVLDEVWRLFPQGQQANKVPDEYKSLLAEHRHMVDAGGSSVQIVFVVQDLANIGSFARRLVEQTFVTTKLSFVGMAGSYRVDIFHGAQTGATPPVSNRLRFITGRYKKDIYALYRSHTMSERDQVDGADESKMDERGNILKRPAFVIGAVLCPLVLWGAMHQLGKAFHGGLNPMKHQPAASPPAGAGPRSGAERPEHAQPANPPISTSQRVASFFGAPSREGSEPTVWRVTATLIDESGEGVAFLSDGKRTVQVDARQCQVSRYEVSCPLDGVNWTRSGRVDASVHPPVAPYTAAKVLQTDSIHGHD